MTSSFPPGPDYYAAGTVVVGVECDDVRLRAAIGDALHDLRVPVGEPSGMVYQVRRSGPSWLPAPWGVERDGRALHAGLTEDQVVTCVLAELVALLVERSPTQVPLRAAAVERGGRAVLLLGRSEDDTSRLALSLAPRGWGLLGDSFVLLDLTTPGVAPFWCPVGGTAGLGADDGSTRARLVPASTVATLAPACPVGVVVVPRPSATEPERLPEAETIASLTEHLAVVGPRGRAHVAALTEAVGSLPAFRVPAADLDRAESTLADLLVQAA